MGFMDQFKPQSQQVQQPGLRERMATLRQIMQGDPSPLMNEFSKSGATCTMPDGRRLTFQQLASEMGGKTPAEAFSQCGYDLNEVMGLINS